MKQKNLVLMVVAVGCGLVAAFLTTQINAKPKIETVEVLVAAKDLPVGTTLSQAEIDKMVETKPMAKDVLPPQFVTTKEELVGKRLSRAVLKGETFSPAVLQKGQIVTLPPGKDLYSVAMTARDAAGGFVGPGSKVDILASLSLGTELKTFPLLVDMHVVAVNQALAYDPAKSAFPDMNTISLAVDQEEALLLSLAEKRGCTLKLLLRRDGKPKDTTYKMAEVRKLLEDQKHPITSKTTEDRNANTGTDLGPVTPPIVTPPPTPVEEPMIKVWVAKENLPGNTALTSDLVAEKFTQVDRPKKYSEDAISDPNPHMTKALVHGISKGSYLTYAMIGEQGPKPAPQDHGIYNLPKPGPTDKPSTGTTTTAPTPVAPEIRDVAVHTPSGTMIHRFLKVKGEWKKVAELTPEQAVRGLQQPSASDKPTGPAAQPTPPEPRTEQKID